MKMQINLELDIPEPLEEHIPGEPAARAIFQGYVERAAQASVEIWAAALRDARSLDGGHVPLCRTESPPLSPEDFWDSVKERPDEDDLN